MNKNIILTLLLLTTVSQSALETDSKPLKDQEPFGYSICPGYENSFLKIHKVWLDPPAPTIGEEYIHVYLTVSVEDYVFVPYWFSTSYYKGIKLLETKVPVESEYYPKDEDGNVIIYQEFRDLGLEKMFLAGRYDADIFIMNAAGKPIACFKAWLNLRKRV